MAFIAKLLQIFGQIFIEMFFLSCFLSAIYILAELGHMTKMAALPIYGKNPSKIFFFRAKGPIAMKSGM